MKFTPDRWLLLALVVAVAVLLYLRFAETPSGSSYRGPVYSGSSLEQEQQRQRMESRINCLARQARDPQGGRGYVIPC